MNLGPSPFEGDTTRIIVMDYWGMQSECAEFASSVAWQIDADLERFKEETLPKMAIHVPIDDIEFERLPCFVTNHKEAEQVAEAWGADLVLWGKAYCNPQGSADGVDIDQDVTVRNVTAGDHAQITLAKVTIQTPTPYTVYPSAALLQSSSPIRRTADGMELSSLGHLDLTRLREAKPFALVEFTLGLHFYHKGNPWIAAFFFDRTSERVLAHEKDRFGDIHTYLGNAYLHLPGREEKSIQHSRRALELTGDANHARRATLLNNIGSALVAQKNYEEAIQYYRQALTIEEATLDSKHAVISVYLGNIGSALNYQGNHEEALAHYKKAIAMNLHGSSEDHLRMAVLHNGAGVALQNLERYDEALGVYENSLERYEKVLDKSDPRIVLVLNNIGIALKARGRYKEAVVRHRQAFDIARRALGDDHPTTDLCRRSLATAIATVSGRPIKGRDRGAIVIRVLPNARGAWPRLQIGDWLRVYRSTVLKNADHLIDLTKKMPQSKEAELVFVRAGITMTVNVDGEPRALEIR